MQDFRNLKVWEKAHVLTLDVYKSSKGFPRDEQYGLTSQTPTILELRLARTSLRDAAEGRITELRRFLQIARGSANEARISSASGQRLAISKSWTFKEFAKYMELKFKDAGVSGAASVTSGRR